MLFPESLDDYVDEENPVRFISALVDNLDLAGAGFDRTKPASTGRPAFDPKDLLKLYIYGYLNKIRSSRRLEKETHRNLEVIWLLGKLRPDHKTIADFRKRNREAFKSVFRAFTAICRTLDLFGGDLIAVDGSKFKASNGRDQHFTQEKLEKRLQDIDAKIEKYLSELDTADQEPEILQSGSTDSPLREKIQALQDRKGNYEELLKELTETGNKEVSLTDGDAREMKARNSTIIGYNAQIAVDAKHKLIVALDVTNEANDSQQLSPVSQEAKEALAVEELRVVADSGYYTGEELKVCEDAGIEPYVPKRNTSSLAKKGMYGKEQFSYDPAQDCYVCPAGQTLECHCIESTTVANHTLKHYTTAACKTCLHRTRCTTNKNGRSIRRWVHEEVLERTDARVAANPDLIKTRKTLVEHPFGTMKFWNDQGHFLVRGLSSVKGEFSLMALAHNLRKVLNLVTVTRLVAALA